jgi:selenocysteine lyase/cysteine desulfurase
VIFTHNTTGALNMMLKGFLKAGDHVLISELEHNAVRRPLVALAQRGVKYSIFPVVGLNTPAILRGIEQRIAPTTVAVICTHASNICSVSLPLAEIGALCRRKKLKCLVDGAQSAGRLPLDMQKMGIDALAVPGHKALLGIQGCGALILGADMSLVPQTEGGSGVDSLSPFMPDEPPERYEAGTLPTPAIAGLAAGITLVRETGIAEIEARERALFLALRERLETLRDVEILQPDAAGAVLLFRHRILPAAAIAELLDRRGICVRAGLHCAPLAHRALGTLKTGAVRVSFGPFNTRADTDALHAALQEI